MATVRLHAHVAPPGAVDLWLGLADVAGPQDLTWTLDGEPAMPQVLRPLTAVRHGEAAPAEGRPRMVTGGFRLPITGDGPVQVEVRCEAGTASLTTRPVPTALPTDRWLNVLLGSCYDRSMERAPLLANEVARRLAEDPDTRPDLSLFMGDQVYLDVPATEVFGRFAEPGLAGITAQFEQDYRLNWMVHLADVLGAAPFVCVPDDHEFWNNYPVRVPWLPRTLRQRGRAEWEHAARRCYDAFQRSVGLDDPAVIDLDTASIFVLDTRTWRRLDRTLSAHPEHLDRLDAWADQVAARSQHPIFVTGQTLFKGRIGTLRGQLTDFELANYGDYPRILAALRRASSPQRPGIVLTGDVHFGRVVQAHDSKGRPRLYEVISSPLALCSDPRSAHQPLLSQLFHRLLGENWLGLNRPWPRHPQASVPPLRLSSGTDAPGLTCLSRYSQVGNQLALLGLKARPDGGLQVRIGFVSLHPDPRRQAITWVGPFDTRSGIDVFTGLGGLLGALGLG